MLRFASFKSDTGTMKSGFPYLWSQGLLDFNLVLGGLQPPLCSLSALFKLLQTASQLLQLGGAVMEPLAQFVHPAVQLSLLISYLQTVCFHQFSFIHLLDLLILIIIQ